MPSEFNVLVLPEEIEDRTAGGIILPDAVKDADKAAGQRARLIAVSPVAFDYASFTEDQKPRVGQVVMFAKYAGTLVDGLDGRKYRIIKDRDVMAVEVAGKTALLEHKLEFSREADLAWESQSGRAA